MRARETLRIRPAARLFGRARVPGDKSVSHRAALLAGIAEGQSRLEGFLDGADCRATLGVLAGLGVPLSRPAPTEVLVEGRGLFGLAPPSAPLDCDNSGTTMRLFAGLLAGQPFESVLVGTPQLSRRPMGRVQGPLSRMGARIEAMGGGAPLRIFGRRPLRALEHESPVASAQVKSALLLAGLYTDGKTTVREPGPSRDHTERLLLAMGVPVIRDRPGRVSIAPPERPLSPLSLHIPGDPSSAAFLAAAATLVPSSDIVLERVCMNPTRDGFFRALSRMGARIDVEDERDEGGEPVATLRVRAAALAGVRFCGPDIVTMIDELPLLAAVATQAEGVTEIREAGELRVKETDRIASTARALTALGARVTALEDGLIIEGPTPLVGARAFSEGDHRLALLLAVLGLVASGETRIDGAEVTDDSFPGFDGALSALGADVERSLG